MQKRNCCLPKSLQLAPAGCAAAAARGTFSHFVRPLACRDGKRPRAGSLTRFPRPKHRVHAALQQARVPRGGRHAASRLAQAHLLRDCIRRVGPKSAHVTLRAYVSGCTAERAQEALLALLCLRCRRRKHLEYVSANMWHSVLLHHAHERRACAQALTAARLWYEGRAVRSNAHARARAEQSHDLETWCVHECVHESGLCVCKGCARVVQKMCKRCARA